MLVMTNVYAENYAGTICQSLPSRDTSCWIKASRMYHNMFIELYNRINGSQLGPKLSQTFGKKLGADNRNQKTDNKNNLGK